MRVPKPPVTKINMATVPRKNYGTTRPKSQITQITFHHIVGDAPAAIAEMQKTTRTMSFSYCISSTGKIYEAAGLGYVAYCDGNLASNKRSVSIEHAGGIPSVPYTEAMYKASARLNAWLIDSLGITSFKRHSQVSNIPTACPGKLDVERIIREAKKIRASYKEQDMLTAEQYNVIRRFYLGAPPTEEQLKRNVGKVTTTEMIRRVRESAKYTAEISRVKNGGSVKGHLPKSIREVYKG